MAIEYKWHRLSDETPEETGEYLVCDERGNIKIKEWEASYEVVHQYCGEIPLNRELVPAHFKKTKAYHSEPATNVYFWTEIPEVPIEVIDKAKAEAIERKIKMLKQQLADLRAEAVAEEA